MNELYLKRVDVALPSAGGCTSLLSHAAFIRTICAFWHDLQVFSSFEKCNKNMVLKKLKCEVSRLLCRVTFTKRQSRHHRSMEVCDREFR